MNMPGFTAEASLYNVSERYQAVTNARHHAGIVQPTFDFAHLGIPIGVIAGVQPDSGFRHLGIPIGVIAGMKVCLHPVRIKVQDGTGGYYTFWGCP